MRSKLTKQDIYSLAKTRDIYIRGHNLYTQGKVSDLELSYDDKGEQEIISVLVGEGEKKIYPVKILVEIETGRIIGHVCRCNHHIMWRGACDHVIAALLYASGSTMATYRANTRQTDEIIASFEKNMLKDIDVDIITPRTSAVSLAPQLYLNKSDLPYVTFNIGVSRFYVVKNITELIQSLYKPQTEMLVFGRDLSFRNRLQSFDERSVSIIKFLRRTISAIDEITSLVTDESDNFQIKRNLPLAKEFADDFFEIMSGGEIELHLTNRLPHYIPVTDSTPDVRFDVSYRQSAPVISGSKSNFQIIAGKRYGYMVGDKVYRVGKSYLKTVAPLLAAINETENLQLSFPAESLQSFYRVVLPQLSKWGLIGEQEQAPEELDSVELVIKAYLSCEAKLVLCRVVFCYGDTEIDPLLAAKTGDIYRDKLKEYRMMKFLDTYDFAKSGEGYYLDDDERIYDFYMSGIESLNEFAEVYATDEFKKKSFLPAPSKAGFGLRFAGNLIELNVDAAGYSIAELLEALEGYRAKKRYHRLKNGRFVNLRDESVQAAEEILGAFDISKKDYNDKVLNLPKYRSLYLDGLLKQKNIRLEHADPEFGALAQKFDNLEQGVRTFPIPPAMEKVLRPYQKIGYEWLRALADYRFGGILADDMGLGKTIQVIALILAEVEAGNKKPSLVVSPTSLVYNWEREFMRFAPEVSVEVLAGLPARRKELLESKNAHVFITTYDTLKRDIENYEQMKFKYVIADEAQYIKNPSTQNAEAIKKIRADGRFALTGTPIENSLSELWSIFDFVMPGYLYSAGKFHKFFEAPIMKSDDTEKAGQLRRQIAPFILRRLKKDVLTELPEKVETNLYAEMEEEQRKIYAAHLLKARGELDTVSNQIEILAQLTRLRQICCHPSLFAENYKGGSGKLDLTIETILSATESGHRVLLFSQFTSMLEILLKALSDNNISYFYLDGKTPSAERIKMVERFNSGEKQVFGISLKAGGTGLNLTGADVVIHYDPWWNPAVMEQASDRAHRFGQEKVVQVINIVTKDSIEEKILELQTRKKNLVDSVITEGGSFLARMSTAEILELFKD